MATVPILSSPGCLLAFLSWHPPSHSYPPHWCPMRLHVCMNKLVFLPLCSCQCLSICLCLSTYTPPPLCFFPSYGWPNAPDQHFNTCRSISALLRYRKAWTNQFMFRQSTYKLNSSTNKNKYIHLHNFAPQCFWGCIGGENIWCLKSLLLKYIHEWKILMAHDMTKGFWTPSYHTHMCFFQSPIPDLLCYSNLHASGKAFH